MAMLEDERGGTFLRLWGTLFDDQDVVLVFTLPAYLAIVGAS